MTPKRIQMTRHKPWRADNPDAVIVARPGRWGNPFLFGPVAASFPSLSDRQVQQFVVNEFRALVRTGRGLAARGVRMSSPEQEEVTYPSVEEIRRELAGKDLACWCALTYPDGTEVPCHATVLLRVAAGGEP